MKHLILWEATRAHVLVTGDKPLLFSLLNAGVALDYSCMQGHCRTCRVRLRQGQVAQKQDVLTEAERQDGFILLCTAFPTSATLSLRLF